ncbi:MAG TPA: hypothetical protein VFN58_06370 [Candidatus Binatia bacterium]|nr:hypothetical protein [Candidatus Binatia bacterium]
MFLNKTAGLFFCTILQRKGTTMVAIYMATELSKEKKDALIEYLKAL